MTELKFGTDGLRGRVGPEINHGVAQKLGQALVEICSEDTWLIGRDTRQSGLSLSKSLAKGLEGKEVADLGIVTTPLAGFAAKTLGAGAVMITASHNPHTDNGFKVFRDNGEKLGQEEQEVVAEHMRQSDTLNGPSGRKLTPAPTTYLADYKRHLTRIVGENGLAGLSLVVDCANGSASKIAPEVLRELGAKVEVINNRPDGKNINKGCGSTQPFSCQKVVPQQKADLGLCFDGDGDRLIAVDDKGLVIDGDRQLALLAPYLDKQGLLEERTVVATIMSNLGLNQALATKGIEVAITAVGDQAVGRALKDGDWSFGGEQSGHLIFVGDQPTGDGLQTAIWLARYFKDHQPTKSSQLAAEAMVALPQVLENIPDKGQLTDRLRYKVDQLIAGVNQPARILVRSSQTEPLIRIMTEAPTEEEANFLNHWAREILR